MKIYNENLAVLMKHYGKVKGLKAVCSACKKYGDEYEKQMIYVRSYGSVYYSIYYNKYDEYEVATNRPPRWFMENYNVINVDGCNTMVDLYTRLINIVGKLK